MDKKLIILLILTAAFATPGVAQFALGGPFLEKMARAKVEFIAPVDGSYRETPLAPNNFLNCDFSMRSRKEKLEIRYLIEPFDETRHDAYLPHLRAARMLMHLASNDESFVMTGLSIDEDALREQFNADWGKVFFFTPKAGFSPYSQCKMLALYREGAGMAYVFFLFDQAGAELDHRFQALRFDDEHRHGVH
jgi:hypothetical protein